MARSNPFCAATTAGLLLLPGVLLLGCGESDSSKAGVTKAVTAGRSGATAGGASVGTGNGDAGGDSSVGAGTGSSAGVGNASSAGTGNANSSGNTSQGGDSSNGGATSAGGAPGSAGSLGSSGAIGSSGAAGSGSKTACKRGIAANIAPGTAFSPKVAWWYNWGTNGTGTKAGMEFVPMFWDSAGMAGTIPSGSKYLLGFNEPNFKAQSNLTPQQAAAAWPTLQTKARAAGVGIVSPAMNYCGPAANCNGTDPYQYLKDFFSACTNCQVDYVAVHWYNCDLPSLKDYLETGANLPGFQQFGKPIWLTEFSCDGSATVAQQEAFMRAAIPYLESSPLVFRYSWFSAGPIPNAQLINSDGSPTALGSVYINLAQSCTP